jgi:hypothetical protein
LWFAYFLIGIKSGKDLEGIFCFEVFECANHGQQNFLIKPFKQQLQKSIKSLPKRQIQWADFSDLVAVLKQQENSTEITLKNVPNKVKDRPVGQLVRILKIIQT